jgi:hypothetical protein
MLAVVSALLAEISGEGEAIDLLALLFVLGCLVAAAVAGWRQAWIACGCLVAVAIIAGALLL